MTYSLLRSIYLFNAFFGNWLNTTPSISKLSQNSPFATEESKRKQEEADRKRLKESMVEDEDKQSGDDDDDDQNKSDQESQDNIKDHLKKPEQKEPVISNVRILLHGHSVSSVIDL